MNNNSIMHNNVQTTEVSNNMTSGDMQELNDVETNVTHTLRNMFTNEKQNRDFFRQRFYFIKKNKNYTK